MEKVRFFKRALGFFIIFFVSIFTYIAIHEAGHLLSGLIFDIEIYDFNLILGSVTMNLSTLSPYERVLSFSGGVFMTFIFTLLFGFFWLRLIHKEKRNSHLHVYFLVQISVLWSDFPGQIINYLLERKTSDFYLIAQIEPTIITCFFVLVVLDIIIYLFIMLKAFSDLYFFHKDNLRKILLLIQ